MGLVDNILSESATLAASLLYHDERGSVRSTTAASTASATIRGAVTLAAGVLLAGCGARAGNGAAAEASGGAAAEVRAARARSNAAIAARDADAVVGFMVPDVVVTAGNGGVLVGRDSSRAAFARQFADSAFLGYVRTPDDVQPSSHRPLAAERGSWVGRWRRADGVQELHGTYLAMWRRTGAGWQIRSELFVTLRCTGSRACSTP